MFSCLQRSYVQVCHAGLLLVSENDYFHGLLNAKSNERLSWLQRCQLEYLISYFGSHHAVSLGSFADALQNNIDRSIVWTP